jgi:hypothetical protein
LPKPEFATREQGDAPPHGDGLLALAADHCMKPSQKKSGRRRLRLEWLRDKGLKVALMPIEKDRIGGVTL